MSAAPVISVIIPVHNTRPYLKQCLESVISQTFSPLEIICIDDGSTDGSCELLQEYSEKRLIRLMENSWAHGQAWTRNQGIRAAKGEYIYFIDSDDWLEPDWLMHLHNAIRRGYDCAVNCGIIWEYPDSSIRQKNDILPRPDETGKSLIAKKSIFLLPNPVWAHIYRASFIRDHNLYFPSGYKRDPYIHEDLYYQFPVYMHCPQIYAISASAYHYRQHDTSTISISLPEICYNFFATFDLAYNYLAQENLLDEYSGALFYLLPEFRVDNPKTYVCCKRFFKKIALHYKSHIAAYHEAEKFFYNAIMNSQFYEEYRDRYPDSIAAAYCRDRAYGMRDYFKQKFRHAATNGKPRSEK